MYLYHHLIHHAAARLRLQAIALDDVQLNDEERLRQVDLEQQYTAEHQLLQIIRLLFVPAKSTINLYGNLYPLPRLGDLTRI